MGNLFHLQILKNPFILLPKCISRKALQVVKMDGKILRFPGPLLVKELLVDFHGFGLKSSRNSSKLLPPSFELKLGRTYYLFPTKVQPEEAAAPNTAAVKRIKVVITKNQLQELLAKKSVDKIVVGMQKSYKLSSTANWKPSLTSIPEEMESNPTKHVN